MNQLVKINQKQTPEGMYFTAQKDREKIIINSPSLSDSTSRQICNKTGKSIK